MIECSIIVFMLLLLVSIWGFLGFIIYHTIKDIRALDEGRYKP